MFGSQLFRGRRVVVGISGCIAAYKSCYLIRWLVEQGAEVRAMMTAGARRFITPLTIETLTRHPVYGEMFPEGFAATHHIDLADWAEVMIVAPATANILGKMANGIGDDFVSTVLLAAHCPVVVAPAMNSHMWNHAAVQRNVHRLREDGVLICDPEEGFLAEGYSGVGRLARLEYLVQHAYRAIHPALESLAGKRVLITAGATREYLDPVRMLTNRSTGKMGFALAWEAWARGAEVILVHGEGALEPPVGITTVPITAAADLHDAVAERFDDSDIYISAAAVADYRPASVSKGKIKKGEGELSLKLARTVDVLRTMADRKRPGQILVGFAVETDDPEANARRKLTGKQLDLVVLNNPLDSGAGFAADTNRVTLLDADHAIPLPVLPKLDVARQMFNHLLGAALDTPEGEGRP